MTLDTQELTVHCFDRQNFHFSKTDCLLAISMQNWFLPFAVGDSSQLLKHTVTDCHV